MLLFSVHPEPEGRKVDKMLTLKKVKEMVKAPAHTKRVPSPKVLLEEGRIFLRKEFEHASINMNPKPRCRIHFSNFSVIFSNTVSPDAFLNSY